MQIVLSDTERKILEKVDTSEFGWGNSEILKENPKFAAVKEYEKKDIVTDGNNR